MDFVHHNMYFCRAGQKTGICDLRYPYKIGYYYKTNMVTYTFFACYMYLTHRGCVLTMSDENDMAFAYGSEHP